jgi:REP element-mobilizing transposase RayT
MRTIFIDICLDYHTQLFEFDDEVEHIQLLINYSLQVEPSKMTHSLKVVSSRL